FSSRAIHPINRSPEMKPWCVVGNYDRPIARRIVEEAGVPRELFGNRKHGGGGYLHGHDLSPESEHDFLEFYQSKVRPNKPGSLSAGRFMNVRRYFMSRWALLRIRLCRRAINSRLASFPAIVDRLHPMWRSKYLYAFHWGFARTKERYESALNKGLDIAQDNNPAARMSVN
ncbi:MAG: hypothetical protein ACREOB_12235, partial [Thermodesulfobacteriota bacterium]